MPGRIVMVIALIITAAIQAQAAPHTGPATIGGPAKKNTGMLFGKPILRNPR